MSIQVFPIKRGPMSPLSEQRNSIEQDFLKDRILFCGSRINSLPYRIFVLYKVLMERYASGGRAFLPPDASASFDEEGRFYRARTESGDQILTRSDTLLWVSRYQDPETGARCFHLGMSHRAADADSPWRGVRIRIPYDQTAAHTYRILDRFRRDNPHKYVFPSSMTADPDDRLLRDLIWSPACPACPRFSACTHAVCPEASAADSLPPALSERNRERMALLAEAAGKTGLVAVVDLEMQDDYPMQFAGLLLRWDGTSYVPDRELNMYISLPAGVRISPYVGRLTGISRDYLLSHGVPEEEAAPEIARFLSEADIICGQTPGKDFELLHLIYERTGLGKPACLTSGSFIDAAVLVQALYDNAQLMSLEKEASLMGLRIGRGKYHNAVTDTSVTGAIFARLFPLFVLCYGRAPVFDLTMTQKTRSSLILERLPGNTPPSEKKKEAGPSGKPAGKAASGIPAPGSKRKKGRSGGSQAGKEVRTRRQTMHRSG